MFKLFERWTQPFPDDKDESIPPNSFWSFCFYYGKGFIKPLILISILSAFSAIIEVSLFGYLGNLINLISASSPIDFWQNNKNELIAWGALVLVIMPIICVLYSLIVHQSLLGNYPMSIRWITHKYLLKQSIDFYQNDFAGRIATKMMQTSIAMRDAVMKTLDIFVYILVYFGAMFILLSDADWQLGLPLLAWLIVYLGLLFYFIPKLKEISSVQAEARSMLTGRLVDTYTNIETVKLFANHDRELLYAKEGMETFLTSVNTQMRLATAFDVSVKFSNYLLLFSVTFLSIYLWMEQLISIGSIAIAIGLSLRINSMSMWIMWEVSNLFENIGTLIDGMHTLSKPINIKDKSNAHAINIDKGKIEFKQVNFSYKNNQAVFKALSLKIRPGEKVGIIGKSGAGKSTLINLLLRMRDIDSGQILVDGQDIRAITQDSLRSQIGIVTQDTALLHRSIRENILYGAPKASEDELLRAARQANAMSFIDDLSGSKKYSGFDLMVGERGVKLSGGQRQRIAIARVLLKNAPILILDEATSALDSESEMAIQENLAQLMEGKTVLAIAHRLSTIASMDRLIVLDNGQIAEEGDHQSLLAQNGIYAKLWQRQVGGFILKE
jgi:ATP-binding cassette subfamily B multidrug efflux pump